jgi:predicted TIM-barrel fold metal-dependent hydrolase
VIARSLKWPVRGAVLCALATSPLLAAEPETDIRELKLRDWQPRSMLVTRTTTLERPMFPAVDVHNHLGGGKQTLTPERVAQYLVEMNEAGVQTVVNLDGGWGQRLKETLAALDESHPGRFLTFALVDFEGIDGDDWSQRETRRLEESFAAGAKGLKFHKSLGLTVRYKNGKLMPVDDPKLDPIWKTCAKFKRPVMIHTADPAAFFTPLDRHNERWHELNEHPDWLFYGEKFPPREQLLAQLKRVVAKNPQTTFIGAHCGNNVEDLAAVGSWLDEHPNYVVDIDARISELGRQPYAARRFLIKYQDRVLFGTDTTPRREAFRIYYRFLETDDEYFDCAASHHLQGFWMIYGVFLPKEVLEKIYHKNAERVLFAAAEGKTPMSTTTAQDVAEPVMKVISAEDFTITGDGRNPAWKKVPWVALSKREPKGHDYDARVKMLYSRKGVYVLFSGSDKRISATMREDFLDLWNEDVFEFFFWPDERQSIYFEYEISPLGYELPILVPNVDGKFLGWRPWHYEGDRKIQKATAVTGGKKDSGAAITGWTAEVFVPYELLTPLGNVPPKPGTRWRANFYRVDYDDDQPTSWDWARVGPSFHEHHKYGTLEFD